MHSTDDLEDGYLGSGKRLKYSINKYGKENHKFEILEFVEDRQKLKELEKEIVTEDLIKEPLCINLKPGGEGGWSLEQKRLNGRIGGKKTFDLKVGWFGISDEKKKERDVKIHKTLKTKKISFYDPNIQKDLTERARSPESCKKRNETFKKIGHQQGEKNSHYGKMWIYNLETLESIRINKEELIPEGWTKGRKIKK